VNPLILFGLLAALVWAVRRMHTAHCPVVICVCGTRAVREDRAEPGWRCGACVARANAITQARGEARIHDEIRRRERQRAARKAVEEAERIAHRHTVRRVGRVLPTPRGPLFDGWIFEDPKVTAGVVPATRAVSVDGAYRRGSLICGWTPSELHELAHGEACHCLSF
jgi:hypothetical protein